MAESTEIMTIEKTEQLFDFLTGGAPPDQITLKPRPPKISARQAFALIYVLQEAFRIIPDCFEQCSYCAWIFDSEREGHIAAGGRFYCDNCSHRCRCQDCKAFRARH